MTKRISTDPAILLERSCFVRICVDRCEAQLDMCFLNLGEKRLPMVVPAPSRLTVGNLGYRWRTSHQGGHSLQVESSPSTCPVPRTRSSFCLTASAPTSNCPSQRQKATTILPINPSRSTFLPTLAATDREKPLRRHISETSRASSISRHTTIEPTFPTFSQFTISSCPRLTVTITTPSRGGPRHHGASFSDPDELPVSFGRRQL